MKGCFLEPSWYREITERKSPMAKEHAGAGNKAPGSAPSTKNARTREVIDAEDEPPREAADAENEAPGEQAMVSHIAPVILLN